MRLPRGAPRIIMHFNCRLRPQVLRCAQNDKSCIQRDHVLSFGNLAFLLQLEANTRYCLSALKSSNAPSQIHYYIF